MTQPTATSLILPHAAHFSEFAGGFNGTCTQTALSICMGISEGQEATQGEMLTITHEMIAAKLCSPNGAATVNSVATYAHSHGFAIDTEWDFGAMGDWHQKLKDHTGHKPILLQVANGQALVDAETGARDESGVHYHALAVVGFQGNGYVCADGDNPQVAERFQVYSYATLAAAQPCGLLILNMQVPPQPPLPAGAVMNGDTMTWNGLMVAPPILPYLASQGYRLGIPLCNAYTLDGEIYQTFAYGELRHNTQDGVFLANIGADVVKYRAILAKIKGDIGS